MDITTANRLYELRKQHGYSQDELAEMLNVSRQAVSKWERSESSPDTDNLIALARLYNVSLDQLLGFDVNKNGDDESQSSCDEEATEPDDGLHIDDGKNHVHIDGSGIHVQDKNGESVHIMGNIAKFVNKVVGEVHVNDDGDDDENECEEECNKHFACDIKSTKVKVKGLVGSIMFVLCLAAYLTIGFVCNLWHPGWLVFLVPMIADGITETIIERNPSRFPVFIIALGTYLLLGFTLGWHPYWAVLFAIPAYHIIVEPIKKSIKSKDDGITIEISRTDGDNEDDKEESD